MVAGSRSVQLRSKTAPKHSLGSIQLWIALFALGTSILGLKSVIFNLVYNHLIFFQWGNLGLLMVSMGLVGLSSFLPDQFNLWLKIKKWSKDHKLFTSLFVIGLLMLNPTFTVLMSMTGYLIEKHFSNQLQRLSDLIQGTYFAMIGFLEFLGGLRNPVEFIKGVKENIAKVIATTLGIGSALAFYASLGWAIRPILFAGLEISANAMQTLGSILNYSFSGGFIPMFVLNAFANTIVYTMAVLVPLSIVFIGGAGAAWLWDNRLSIADAIDKKFDAIIKNYCDPVILSLADKTRAFRAKYMGMKFKDKSVEHTKSPLSVEGTTSVATSTQENPRKRGLNFDEALCVLEAHHRTVMQSKAGKGALTKKCKSESENDPTSLGTKSHPIEVLDAPVRHSSTRSKPTKA
ncbi:hypothetical protein CC99x_000050 [Candidatus Berkiella cookevillensis]|uniref:Uncharacterized protein n=1 Tax=Candidatus Berkiella cookevillensis TaxID=437022 RepID=A0A0Q9YEB4_9GAMM|nr:hypothetical protein [Candidatus Berkiella cookevillensis]MCS5707286.1 hypothetical protein [Candidatus Berkiella cookevillensis]